MSRPTVAAVAVSVDTALQWLTAGRFRVPAFQRPFAWSRKQTIPFFDTIVAGLPTGAITVFEDAAEAAEVTIGPLRVSAPADPSAFWVVDGLQRLGTLAGALLAEPRSVLPEFRLAYDLESDRMHPRDYGYEPPAHLLPLHVVADGSAFAKWLVEQGPDAVPYLEKALDVRLRILQYPLTLVRVQAGMESAMETFLKLNGGGVALNPADVANAWNPEKASHTPTNISDVAKRLSSTGFGPVPPDAVRSSAEAIRDPELDGPVLDPPSAVAAAERALAVTIAWLRDEAAVPHLAVWQEHMGLLPALARFFHLNREPSARARVLLRRWLWRILDDYAPGMVPFPVITGRDSADVSDLLARVDNRRPGPDYLIGVGQPLALAVLGPISLATGRPLNVPEVLETHGPDAFRTITGPALVLSPPDDGPLDDLLRAAWARPEVLASHALDREALRYLFDGHASAFAQRRSMMLSDRLLRFADRQAEWGVSDRPAIADLMVLDEDDDHAG